MSRRPELGRSSLSRKGSEGNLAAVAISGEAVDVELPDAEEMTEEEIDCRWGPVSYMVAIVMQRQAGSKRMPERAPRVPKVGPAREAGGPWAAIGRCAGAPAAS